MQMIFFRDFDRVRVFWCSVCGPNLFIGFDEINGYFLRGWARPMWLHRAHYIDLDPWSLMAFQSNSRRMPFLCISCASTASRKCVIVHLWGRAYRQRHRVRALSPVVALRHRRTLVQGQRTAMPPVDGNLSLVTPPSWRGAIWMFNYITLNVCMCVCIYYLPAPLLI